MTSLADRLKIDFALIHNDRTRVTRSNSTAPVTPINESSAEGSFSNENHHDNDNSNNNSNNSNNDDDYFHSNAIVNDKTFEEDECKSSSTSFTEGLFSEEGSELSTSSNITLVGDVAGKVVFIVVSILPFHLFNKLINQLIPHELLFLFNLFIIHLLLG